MKKIGLSSLLTFTLLTVVAQTKVYFGLESGVALFKKGIYESLYNGNTIGIVNSYEKQQAPLSPTGFRIGIETPKKWSFELGGLYKLSNRF